MKISLQLTENIVCTAKHLYVNSNKKFQINVVCRKVQQHLRLVLGRQNHTDAKPCISLTSKSSLYDYRPCIQNTGCLCWQAIKFLEKCRKTVVCSTCLFCIFISVIPQKLQLCLLYSLFQFVLVFNKSFYFCSQSLKVFLWEKERMG